MTFELRNNFDNSLETVKYIFSELVAEFDRQLEFFKICFVLQIKSLFKPPSLSLSS